MNKTKALNQSYTGTEEQANAKETREAQSRAYACDYFGVKHNIPSLILKEAIFQHTGKEMGYCEFQHGRE